MITNCLMILYLFQPPTNHHPTIAGTISQTLLHLICLQAVQHLISVFALKFSKKKNDPRRDVGEHTCRFSFSSGSNSGRRHLHLPVTACSEESTRPFSAREQSAQVHQLHLTGRVIAASPRATSGTSPAASDATLLFPKAPSTFSEGVWGGFGGSKHLLRRYLEP